jgi:signal transduction histidine kinase
LNRQLIEVGAEWAQAQPIRVGRMSDQDPTTLDSAAPAVQPGRHLRLSMRAKLALGVVVAGLPLFALAAWLAWDTPFLWLVWVCGLLSLALGLGITAWANRPLSDLAQQARNLAGLSSDNQRLFGLIRTDPPGDEAIAVALERIETSLQEIHALNRIGQLVASEDDLGLLLSTIVEEAVALLRADAGLIGSWDAEQEVFRDVAACNLPIMFPGREFGAGESLSSYVAKTGTVVFVEDYAQYPYRIPELDRFQLRAALGVPLMVGDQCKGALVVHSVNPDRRFTTREGELLATFASQAGAAFEKARLYQLSLDQLERLELARAELETALATVVRIQEEERSRIAADVHDGVVQMMAGGLCELQAAMAYFPQEPELVEAKQQRARELVRDSITELRRVIYDLRPIALDAAGLAPAVETLIDDLQNGCDVRLQLRVLGTPGRLSPDVEISAYRIIQEALNNVIKHSAATKAQVGIRFAEGALHISVCDDGEGFSLEESASSHGQSAGLIGMRERARGVGGTLSVSSQIGGGTAVSAEIPCTPREALDRHPAAHQRRVVAPSSDGSVDCGGDEESR